MQRTVPPRMLQCSATVQRVHCDQLPPAQLMPLKHAQHPVYGQHEHSTQRQRHLPPPAPARLVPIAPVGRRGSLKCSLLAAAGASGHVQRSDAKTTAHVPPAAWSREVVAACRATTGLTRSRNARPRGRSRCVQRSLDVNSKMRYTAVSPHPVEGMKTESCSAGVVEGRGEAVAQTHGSRASVRHGRGQFVLISMAS